MRGINDTDRINAIDTILKEEGIGGGTVSFDIVDPKFINNQGALEMFTVLTQHVQTFDIRDLLNILVMACREDGLMK